MQTLTTTVAELLGELHSSFAPNELAYLALTQKVEHAIRDRLAFALHRRLGENTTPLVCREWKRFDLAVLDGETPKLLLEAKAMYTFDIVKDGTPYPYPEFLQRDVAKAMNLKAAPSETFPEVLTLLLATHPHDSPSKEYAQAVKYCGDIVKYARRGIDIPQADDEVKRRLSAHPRAAHSVIPGGSAFGMRVSVAYWLFGPYVDRV